MHPTLYKIKRNPVLRMLFANFKRLFLFVLFPQVIIDTCRILFFHWGKQKIVVVLLQRIGDIVASEPIDRYLKEQYPNAYVIRLVRPRYRELLQLNPNVDKIISVNRMPEWICIKLLLYYFSKIKIVDMHIYTCKLNFLTATNSLGIRGEICFKYGNLLEIFSQVAGLPKLNERPIYHLPKNKPELYLPDKYIVFHTQGSEAYRSWTEEKWNKVADFLMEKGYYVVEIGLHPRIHSHSEKFINYCGKLSLTKIAFLIRDCELFIGIDSAFAHFANALNVKNKVLLFGWWHNRLNNYLPYSGMSAEEIENTIIRYDGHLNDLPIEPVLKKLNSVLGNN
jgi:heptosyltransferase-3